MINQDKTTEEKLSIILEEIHAIKKTLEELLIAEKNLDEQKSSKVTEAYDIAPIMRKAFENKTRIKRGDLYKMELQTAKNECRRPIMKHTFYKMVADHGYRLIKSVGEYYFCL